MQDSDQVKRARREPVAESDDTANANEGAQQQAALRILQPRALTRALGPLYRQLADHLRKPIESGELAVGSPLPREADLAAQYGVSLITIRQALRDLEAEGLIRKRTAKPAIVTSRQDRSKPLAFQSFAAIAASSVDRQLVIKSYRKEQSALACEAFNLPVGTAFSCLRAVLRKNDQVVTQTAFYFPPAIGERLKRADFDDVVVFRAVQRHLGINLSRAQIRVRAELADEALAKALGYEVGGAILVAEMLYFSTTGEPVELTVSRNRGDLFSISYEAPNDLL